MLFSMGRVLIESEMGFLLQVAWTSAGLWFDAPQKARIPAAIVGSRPIQFYADLVASSSEVIDEVRLGTSTTNCDGDTRPRGRVRHAVVGVVIPGVHFHGLGSVYIPGWI